MRTIFFNLIFCAAVVAAADPITPTERELAALSDIKAKDRAPVVEKLAGKPVKLTGTLSHRGGMVQQFQQDVFTITIGKQSVRVVFAGDEPAIEELRKRFAKPAVVTIAATLEVIEGGRPAKATVTLKDATIQPKK